jgi:hypothetical protein
MEEVARLPKMTEVDFNWVICDGPIPIGLFSNLSKLPVLCCDNGYLSSFILQWATIISNSPHLRFLAMCYPADLDPPTLSDLFAKVSTKNPLCLEHLSIGYMDATVNQVILPHLTHLASFDLELEGEDLPIAQSTWNSLLVNNFKLSVVAIRGHMTKEAILFLSSFSGLKRIIVEYFGEGEESVKSMFFSEVLPKHVNTLRMLELTDWVGHLVIPFLLLSP